MKSFLDIASGTRYRKNHLLRTVTEDAHKRYAQLAVTKLDKTLPLSLILAAPEVTAAVMEAKVSGPKATDAALINLTTYIAWLLPENSCAQDESFAESLGTTLAEMQAQRDAVFPLSLAVETAITRFKANREFFCAGDGMSDEKMLQYTHERWDIIGGLLFRQPVVGMFRSEVDIMTYGLRIDNAITMGDGIFTETFSNFRANPDLLL